MKTTFDVSLGLQATGTSQSDATPLPTDFCVVDSMTSGSAGVILPDNAKVGEMFAIVMNAGVTNNLSVYPPVGGILTAPNSMTGGNPLSTNQPILVGGNGNIVIFFALGNGAFSAGILV